MRWYAGSEGAPPQPRDVLRHPVTGSLYRVIEASWRESDREWRWLRLEGLGTVPLRMDPPPRVIDYATAPHGRHSHRDE